MDLEKLKKMQQSQRIGECLSFKSILEHDGAGEPVACPMNITPQLRALLTFIASRVRNLQSFL